MSDTYRFKPEIVVLKDRVTGTLYQLSAPGGVLTPSAISVVGESMQLMEPQGLLGMGEDPPCYALFISNGALAIEAWPRNRTQPFYVQDGAITYWIAVLDGVITGLNIDTIYDDAVYDDGVYDVVGTEEHGKFHG